MPLPAMPDLADIEARAQHLWEQSRIHEFDPDGPGPVFSVDTPPPYVSAAHLHVGHAMSYAQAEFVVRYQRRRGQARLLPDGLRRQRPAHRALRRAGPRRRPRTISRSEFRRLCLKETRRGAATYEALWRALGLSVDWRYRYSTIDDRCRRTAQASFLDLWRRGRIYRTDAPVQWDPQAQTSLVQADIETRPRQARLYEIAFSDGARIATTRPELLPACVALYRHPDDARWAHLDGPRSPCRCSATRCRCWPTPTCGPTSARGCSWSARSATATTSSAGAATACRHGSASAPTAA